MNPINVQFSFTTVSAAIAFLSSLPPLTGAAASVVNLQPTTPPTPTPVPPAPPAPTRYFFDPSHNNAYEVKPGEVMPSIPTAVEIDAAKYTQIKQSLALLTGAIGAGTSASPAATTAAPAAAGAGLDDMFGGPAPTPTGSAPMTAEQFTNALKAKVDPAANPGGRAKLAAFFQKKGVTQISQLTAGKSDVELGALFVEAAAALA